VGFVVDKVSLEQVYSEYFSFPLPILIPPTAPHSSSIIRDWYNRPVGGRRTKWTQSPSPQRNVAVRRGPYPIHVGYRRVRTFLIQTIIM
jgi:hypothetical protein